MITIDGKQIKLQIWDTVTELLNIYTLFIQQECKKKNLTHKVHEIFESIKKKKIGYTRTLVMQLSSLVSRWSHSSTFKSSSSSAGGREQQNRCTFSFPTARSHSPHCYLIIPLVRWLNDNQQETD